MADWDNDNLADEGPLESDLEELGGDDESSTAPCSACGAEIYDDSPQCPACGQYILATGNSTHGLTRWYLIAAAIALIAFVCYILL
jgi:hypothetical protein